MTSRRRIVIGNWKMNCSVPDALKLATGLRHHIKTTPDIDVVFAPPFTAIYSVGVAMQDASFFLAAQNCHWEDEGPYTGEVSAFFLSDIGCQFVILGHSERRQLFGETDENVNKKVVSALRADLIPIICIGETEAQREAGETSAVLDRQLKTALYGLHQKEVENLIIAYEPVWAIGTGKSATPGQAVECHQHIRNLLGKLFDGPTSAQIRIIYGGSVKAENAAALAKEESIDGCLVGGASLDASEFSGIIRAMESSPQSGV